MHLPLGAKDYAASAEALDLYRAYWHREPLPSHADAMTLGLARTESLHWACPMFGQTVSRQNAKTDAVENRELYEILRGGAVAHTAQQHQIAKNSYVRLMEIIDGSDELRPLVKRAPASNQEVLIELKTGGIIKFVARASNKGLRGLDDISLLVFDEAQHLTPDQFDAAKSVTKVNPNPQTWLAGTAHIKGLPGMWWGYRIQALRGDSETLGWLEHSAETLQLNDEGEVEQIQPDDLSDRRLWQIANPGYEITISERNLATDFEAAQGDKAGFGRESLNIWDPPDSGAAAKPKIDPHWWRSCADRKGEVAGQVVVAVDTTFDLDRSALIVVGRQDDARRRIEVVQQDQGSHWLEIALLDVLEAQRVMAITFDASGPAKSLRPMIERVVAEHNAAHPEDDDVKIAALPLGRYQAACAQLVADAKVAAIAHDGNTSLAGLATTTPERKIGDGWIWDRRVGDICLLVASTCGSAVADSLPEIEKSTPVRISMVIGG